MLMASTNDEELVHIAADLSATSLPNRINNEIILRDIIIIRL